MPRQLRKWVWIALSLIAACFALAAAADSPSKRRTTGGLQDGPVFTTSSEPEIVRRVTPLPADASVQPTFDPDFDSLQLK